METCEQLVESRHGIQMENSTWHLDQHGPDKVQLYIHRLTATQIGPKIHHSGAVHTARLHLQLQAVLQVSTMRLFIRDNEKGEKIWKQKNRFAYCMQ